MQKKKVKKSIKKISKKSIRITPKKVVKKPQKVARKNTQKTDEQKASSYVKIGIDGFDSLFENGYGIPNGAAVLVEGGPGSGKTIFCLASLMSLVKQGKKCLYMSFEEPEERLIDHMKNFNWDPEFYIKKGLLRVKRFDAIDVSRSVEALLSAAKKELLIEIDPVLFPRDFKPEFVVIDSLTSIASAFSGHESRFRIYMEQLFRYLEKNKITNFLIREVSTPTHLGSSYKEEGEAVSFLSDGIIVLYNVIYNDGKRGSAIEVLKLRGTDFQKKIVKMDIVDKKGVIVHNDQILSKDQQKGFVLT